MELKLINIRKKYKNQEVLKGINLVASSGECIGLTGRNGCGKTTLLSILAGVEKADSGEIFIDGRSVADKRELFDGYVGYLPQADPFPDRMSVKDCLKLWCNGRKEYEAVVKKYNLSEMLTKKTEQLSGGMKRRVSIACALANYPGILIMDEPTAALDVEYKGIIHKDMMDFVASGGLIILVTHEKEEMEMCTRCFEIRNGILDNLR